jgi:hypothetical protein
MFLLNHIYIPFQGHFFICDLIEFDFCGMYIEL